MGWFNVRISVILLSCTGVIIHYINRVNINIGVLTMTENQEKLCTNSTDYSKINENGDSIICWSETQSNLLKGAFFYGYILTQVIGGAASEMYGSKLVLLVSMFTGAVVCFLSPFASLWNFTAIFSLRIILGLSQGVLFPSISPLITRWIPESERTRSVSFILIGSSLGTVVAYPLCGLILDNLDWQSMFYINGGVSLLWAIIWALWMKDRPENHCLISESEKAYIVSTRLEKVQTSESPPYLSIITHPHVWLSMAIEFLTNWSFYLLLIQIPLFIKHILGESTVKVGFLSSLPYILRIVCSLAGGFISDFLINRNILSKKWARKVIEMIGTMAPGIALATLGFTSNYTFIIVCLIVSVGFTGFTQAAQSHYPIDISQKYAGTINGFVNGFSNITGFVTPLLTTLIIGEDLTNVMKWTLLFWTGSATVFTAMLLYLFFATFEQQTFDKPFSYFRKKSNSYTLSTPTTSTCDTINNHKY